MRAGSALFVCVPSLLALSGACKPVPEVDWTCDYDASVARPLADRDATPDEAGELPSTVCGDTCGPPAHSCTFTLLDGGEPGAVCPVCTF
jgi:hypothetical protein